MTAGVLERVLVLGVAHGINPAISRLGLPVLRTAWMNVNAIRATALIVTALVTPLV